MQRNKKIFKYILPIFTLVFFAASLFAQHTNPEHHSTENAPHDSAVVAEHQDLSAEAHEGTEHHDENHEKFDAGKTIMDHVVDAYDWHLFTLGHEHYSIPLPMIIKDDRGLHIFSSSRFHHGHESYEGYSLDNGKLVSDTNADFYDFSISKNVAAMLIAVIILCLIMLSIAGRYKKNTHAAPKGIQSLLEPIIIFLRDEVIKPSIGPRYEKFVPFLLTVFFFIFVVNLFGLLPFFPGGANVTGNVAVTMVLALFTFAIMSWNGNKNYWMHIIMPPGVPGWLLPLMIVIEIIGMLSKPIVLTIRLFANMLAGHIIILGFLSLIFIFGEMSTGVGLGVSVVSVAFSIFMYMLELLVAFLQAYVFTLLSSLYFGMAVEEHHHNDHH